MSFLPYEQITFSTSLDIDEILLRLDKVIGQSGRVNEQFFGSKPYQGMIVGWLFSASRIRPFWPWVLPVISGEIHPLENRCSVRITISPENSRKWLVVIWACLHALIILSCLIFLIISLMQINTIGSILSYFVMGFFSLEYLFTWILFKGESVQYKSFFCDLLESDT